MIEPIDNNELSFKLRFKNGEDLTMPIDEPIGWEDVNLTIEQGDMYARTFKIGNEDFKLKFTPIADFYDSPFEKLIEYYNNFGYESIVEMIVSIGGVKWFSCELDFSSAVTNKENFFECSVKVENIGAEIERKSDVKVDLLSNKTLDGKYIEPIELKSVRLRAKEILDVSKHQNNEEGTTEDVYSDLGKEGKANYASNVRFKFFGHQVFSGVKETYNYENGEFTGIGFMRSHIAKENLGVTHSIKDKGKVKIKIKFDYEVHNVDRFTFTLFYIFFVQSDTEDFEEYRENEELRNLFMIRNNNSSGHIEIEKEVEITTFTKIAPAFVVNSNGGGINKNSFVRVSNVSMDVQMVSLFPDTNAQMCRLIDAGKQVLSNYTNGVAKFEHPLFDKLKVFYDLFVTTGFYVRGFLGAKIPLNYKDWLEEIQSFNCDVQINGDNIFIGRQEEFYTDIEMARFPFLADVDSFEISYNEERLFNKFIFAYDKYEDNDKSNTLDAFHTETEWYVPNKRIREEKEVKSPFITDPYKIEYTRREGIDVEPTTAKKEDDDFYLVDVIEKTEEVRRPFFGTRTITYLTNRANEGFSYINNLFSPSTTYNLRLSPKRVILDHWGHFISEINRYTDNLKLENSYFKNNGKLETEASISDFTTSLRVTENGDVTGKMLPNRLIEPLIYTFDLGERVKFNAIQDLFDKIINQRGYITFYDDYSEIQVYPKKIEYEWKYEKLKIVSELRKIIKK